MASTHAHEYGVSDLIQPCALVADGAVALKDGGLLAAWQFDGPDFDACEYARAAAVRDKLASILNYGRGWVFESNVIKTEVKRYPAWGSFPKHAKVARLIEEERRANYTGDGYYESRRYMSLAYFPPSTSEEKAKGWFYESPEGAGLAEQALRKFNSTVDAFESVCSGFLHMRRLRKERLSMDWRDAEVDELLCYLRLCISGEDMPFPVPDIDVDLDLLLGGPHMFGGMLPCFDGSQGRPMRVLAVDPVPQWIFPGMLRALESLPMEFRLHTRAILLDQQDAVALHEANRKRHSSKIIPFLAQVMRRGDGPINGRAVELTADATAAKALAEDSREATALFSARIVLVRDTEPEMKEAIAMVRRAAIAAHVPVRLETINAADAWCGSLPGHAFFDVRQVPVRSFNIASMAPLHSAWRGEPQCPSKLFPPNSSPLIVATGDGQELFTHNLHVSDVGHTFVFGPVSSGKTTLFGLHAVSLLRYPGAQVVMFDRMRTQYVLCKALNGKYYDFSGGSTLQLCPLQHLETESDLAWAAKWIEDRCAANSLDIRPEHRAAISATLERFRRSSYRSLTHFAGAVGDREIAEALQLYTVGNTASGGVLDGERDDIEDSHFTVFEMAELMQMNDLIAGGVKTYLFRRIERKLDTAHVTGIFIDEARPLIGDAVFAPQIKNWLAEIRQRNAFVTLATQEIEDIATSLLRSAIEQECRTKIFLPNPEAKTEATAKAYRSLGLDDYRIAQVQAGTPKREYFISNGHWSKVTFDLSPATLAFIASNSDKDRLDADRMIAANPQGWQADWLRARRLNDWAEYWDGM